MNYALLVLVVAGLLAFAGSAVAPGVCVSVEGTASAIVAFVSDPSPDLIVGPGGIVDSDIVC